MNGNRKEAGDSRETGVFGTRVSEEKRLQLGQGHSEFGDVVVVQLRDAFATVVFVLVAAAPHVEVDQVPKTLNRGDGRRIDADTDNFFDVQDFQ